MPTNGLQDLRAVYRVDDWPQVTRTLTKWERREARKKKLDHLLRAIGDRPCMVCGKRKVFKIGGPDHLACLHREPSPVHLVNAHDVMRELYR